VSVLRGVCILLGAVALACGAISFYRVMTQKRRRFGEKLLSPWKALTFRFTVGGLSMMLLLNIFFWLMTSAYLVRGAIADALPGFVGEARIDQSSTVRESVRDWQLYYTNVTDERYAGATVYSTFTGWMKGELNGKEARAQFDAIDSWSFVSQIFYPIAILLFVANFVFVLLGLISCHKRGLWDLFPFALLMPFYWVLISIAAIKGFWQLFTNPWYWEKTEHGLTHQEPTPPTPPTPPPVEQAGPVASI
jgi:hypothetical protein